MSIVNDRINPRGLFVEMSFRGGGLIWGGGGVVKREGAYKIMQKFSRSRLRSSLIKGAASIISNKIFGNILFDKLHEKKKKEKKNTLTLTWML